MNILRSCSIILVLKVILSVGDEKGCRTEHHNQTLFCCSGYKKINKTCTECVGFYGKDCTIECPTGFYGKLCKQKCMCTETETCNLFVGCVDINIKCKWNSNNETNPIQECDLLVHAAMGFVVLQIFTLIFISLLCLYRYRRLSKYEIQNIMDKSTDSPNQFQELQLIRSEELEENIDFLPESMKENTNHKVHGKQTHDYSRVYFPKFKIVDTPADEYSKTIISRQQVDEHKRKIVYSKDQDKVNMQSTIFFYRTT